ncbi:MAG: hypothetical protein EOM26_10435 [Alphaproteobacteria bacterium]|nr:hypothetical protein [Alphaproteobacteria bacterium]
MRNVHIAIEFEEHRRLLIEDFWYGNMVPILMMATEQLTVMALEQLQMLGSFFDAKTQLETQDLIRSLHAQAHKDYRPSVGICELGSAMRSLHASDARSDWTKLVLTHRAMQRNLGTLGTSAMRGRVMDIDARLNQYVDTYCSPRDFNRGTEALCEATATDAERRNSDIDWPRTVSEHGTLDVDFTVQGTPTDAEVDVFALMSYLYGHDAFTRIPPMFLREQDSSAETNPLRELYLDLRAVVAKRNVAENSYAHLVAMRAEGTDLAVEYLEALLEDLGIPEERIVDVLGENPSYYQQMEVLTKLIHYNPDFYVNLYETPANVLRKRVALQAIGILQKWDTLQSSWRSEMLAAVAAEVRLMETQQDVENEFGRIVGEGFVTEVP